MKPDVEVLDEVTGALCEWGLLSRAEGEQSRVLLGGGFVFAEAIGAAESIHLHLKVEDVAGMPRQRIEGLGARVENATDGYVKYRCAGGINLIFSSIPVAADDLVEGAVSADMPFLDHGGVDIRVNDAAHRAVFDAVPKRATTAGWRRVSQDGPVRCCHTEVSGKHWVYPPLGPTGWARPLEVAFGPLTISGAAMGCDLRPMDPAHPLASSGRASSGGCTGSPAPAALAPEPATASWDEL